MKRVFQHPSAPTSGRRYWRSADELADTPEFANGWSANFHPARATEWRRMVAPELFETDGASVALAGFGVSSCRRPELHLVPFTKTVEWTIPANSSTTARRCRGETGRFRSWLRPLTAANQARRQSAASGKQRCQRCVRAGRITSFTIRCEQSALPRMAKPPPAAFEKYLGDLRTKIGDGASLAFLVEESHSPSAKNSRRTGENVPRMRWCVYDPLRSEAQNFATQISFGDNLRLVLGLSAPM